MKTEPYAATGYSWRWNHVNNLNQRPVLFLHTPEQAPLIGAIEWRLPEDFPLCWAGSSPWLVQAVTYRPFPAGSPERAAILQEVAGSYPFAAIFLLEQESADSLAADCRSLRKAAPDARILLCGDGGLPVVREDAGTEVLPLPEGPEAQAELLARVSEDAAHPVSPSTQTELWVREEAEWTNFSFDDAAGSRLLLVGDSISNGYGDRVRELLRGFCAVDELQTSEGTACPRMERLLDFALDRREYRMIHFNNGIHLHGVTPEEYRENLQRLFAHIRAKSGGVLAFATTTPIHCPKELERVDEAETARFSSYNQAAGELCREEAVPVDDLFQTAIKQSLPKVDAFHFAPEGYQRLAEQVAYFVKRNIR